MLTPLKNRLQPSKDVLVNIDERFMAEALLEAEKAFNLGEVPVGAVLVKDGQIIARAHNSVESSKKATDHAELLCIQQASAVLGGWRLTGTTLYSTLEPCAMCAGALVLARVETLVYGAQDLRHGAHGSLCNFLDIPHPIHKVCIRKDVRAEESGALLKKFFRLRRSERGEVI